MGHDPDAGHPGLTVTNAKLFGREGQIGVIAPDAHADIIAVDGNPLDDVSELESIDFIMKGGVVVKGRQDAD